MIHSITSDLDTFKPLQFNKGLNILLAEKTTDASDRQSRNGAGKTSFVELVHFLFGGNAEKNSIFRTADLIAASFDAMVDLGGHVVSSRRRGTYHSKIIIRGKSAHWPVKPFFDKKTGEFTLTNENWKSNLGNLMFNLPIDPESQKSFQATFRAAFSYFARRQNSGGFDATAQEAHKNQQLWNQQVVVSHLLGLDPDISTEFQELRSQEKSLTQLRKIAREGGLGKLFGNVAGIRTDLTIAQDKAYDLKRRLSTFRVVDEYEAFEQEATEITQAISRINNEISMDKHLIVHLESSIQDERPPPTADVEQLYGEVGVILPNSVRRRYDEVEKFYNAVIKNRKIHLSDEISDAKQRVKESLEERTSLDLRRSQLMEILESGGALEHYTNLREELGRAEAEVESLKLRLEHAKRIEDTKLRLDGERSRLQTALNNDIEERQEIVIEAIRMFENLSQSLYERTGKLNIATTPNGITFDVNIESQRSKGISNMQLFCFDLMLASLTHKKGMGPGFLIHDSHLFDGVDQRQIAKALLLGADQADKIGFQYIVTMNSDTLLKCEFPEGFDVWSHVNPTRLTDELETGGLFGLRFG